MTNPFVPVPYYALTIDPVHVGTGGFRLGRVDNTIVREPSTDVPKIPGSSIAGVARSCTALAIQSKTPAKKKYSRTWSDVNGVTVHASCAGKGAEEGEGHCGQYNCEVCSAYGFSKKTESFQGLAQFYDARILFFPVQSSKGPVWITSPALLREYYAIHAAANIRLIENEEEELLTALVVAGAKINIGWLYLKNKHQTAPLSIEALPAAVHAQLNPIINRLVLVPDSLFSRVVNDNLEVRTSVAIDPKTGAAEDGALFTYEAIPRATVMLFDVVYNDPNYFKIAGREISKDDGSAANTKWVQDNVELGLAYFEYTGLGGMNTRGMGRFKILNLGGA